MAREVDLTKPLSEEDAAYVSQRPWLQTEIRLHELNGTLVLDEDETDEDQDLTGYEEFKVPELKEALKERGLSVDGSKADLIARLVSDDEAEEDDEEDEE